MAGVVKAERLLFVANPVTGHTCSGCRVSPAKSVQFSSLGRVESFKNAILQVSGKSFSSRNSVRVVPRAYTVEIEHDGSTTTLEVPEDETILSVALDNGLDLPHDCKLGVCMTCPARLVSGVVDQTEGMLSDDVQEKGYALMCASYPRSDCKIKVIPEEELLQVQLMTSDS